MRPLEISISITNFAFLKLILPPDSPGATVPRPATDAKSADD